jgi:hypothetical protein
MNGMESINVQGFCCVCSCLKITLCVDDMQTLRKREAAIDYRRAWCEDGFGCACATQNLIHQCIQSNYLFVHNTEFIRFFIFACVWFLLQYCLFAFSLFYSILFLVRVVLHFAIFLTFSVPIFRQRRRPCLPTAHDSDLRKPRSMDQVCSVSFDWPNQWTIPCLWLQAKPM